MIYVSLKNMFFQHIFCTFIRKNNKDNKIRRYANAKS